MTTSVTSDQTVWDEMVVLLDSSGFQSYPVAELDELDDEVKSKGPKPFTIIQLVRGSVGVAPNHAGRSTDCFWGFQEMTKTLNRIWAILEDALQTIDSGQLSIVAWCFGPPERERAEIRKVIQVASELAPDLRAVRFPVRPLSPHLTGIRTPETALINLIGIVKVFEKIAYGDLLSSIQKDPMSNSVLLSELEQRISVSNWSGADCDRESPIPHLLARSYSAFVDRTSDAEHRPTLVSFLQHLDGRSSLKGSSDRELAKRLAADPSVGVLPTHLRNLFDRHQKR